MQERFLTKSLFKLDVYLKFFKEINFRKYSRMSKQEILYSPQIF